MLLEANPDEPGLGTSGQALPGQPLLPDLLVFRELAREQQLGRVVGKSSDDNRLDHALGKSLAQPTKVFLEPAHHDRLEVRGLDLHAADEALGVEDAHQRIGSEQRRVIEALAPYTRPAGVVEDAGVKLMLPEHDRLAALSIIVDAGSRDERSVAVLRRRLNILDQPATLPHMNQLTQVLAPIPKPARSIPLSNSSFGIANLPPIVNQARRGV
jgi:hypothetical protein